MKATITKEMAREFYRDLCGTAYGCPDMSCQGIMSVEHIADLMNIAVESASEFLWACAKYGITERQGGAWVV